MDKSDHIVHFSPFLSISVHFSPLLSIKNKPLTFPGVVISFILTALLTFWRQYPALYYALAMLLGVYAALSWTLMLGVPTILLLLPMVISKEFLRCGLFAGVLVFSFLFVNFKTELPKLPPEGVFGTAVIDITSVSLSSTQFGRQWSLRGVIQSFKSDDAHIQGTNVPYLLTIPCKTDCLRPLANRSYSVHTLLKMSASGRYILSISKDAPWYPVEGSWSTAEYRFQFKQQVSAYIIKHITGHQAAAFLAGIATGDFDDRAMQMDFGRFGLQHIMAISGFHFAIIASILSLFLRFILKAKQATLLLSILLSSYFIFLGCGPSIMRAWIMSMIVLMGGLLARRSSGLNALGIAMLAILLYDPLVCQSLGFQFSFATTFAILLLYGSCDFLMQKIFFKRALSQMVEMNRPNQHAYCFLTFVRQGLALTLAVNIVALPVMLFYFQKFPLLSLAYNLFFPFMVSLSMLLLLVGMGLSLLLPSVGQLIHDLNSIYTNFMLSFTHNLPISLDIIWRVQPLHADFLIVYLSVVALLGIYLKHYLQKINEEGIDFSYSFL